MSDPTTTTTATDARLVDRSLTRVGQRRGVSTSMVALGRHAARRVLGLRRPLRYKLIPVVIALIAYLPAVAFLGVAAVVPEEMANEVLPAPADFYGSILVAVILFTALAGPQTLCPDRRHRTLGLYLASPLDRTTYLAANAAALVVVLAVVTIGPPLVAQIGFSLLDVVGPSVVVVVARALASGAVLAVLFAMVGLAGASLTARRGFASAGIFLGLVGLTIVSQVLTQALDLPQWVQMIDVATLGIAVVARIQGAPAVDMPDVATAVLALGAIVWVVGLAALVHWRYRHLEVVR